jgi:hypothetical protein
MAIAFRAAGTLVDNATATSITITKPAGLTAADTVIVYMMQSLSASTVVISPPDNTWTNVPLIASQATGNNLQITCFTHVALVSEPTWTFTLSASTRTIGRSIAYSGAASVDVVGLNQGSSSPAVAPAATVTNAGDTIVCAVLNNASGGSSAVTLDAGLTSRCNNTTGDTDWTLAIGDATGPGAGSPTTAYSNTVTTAAWVVPIVALTTAGSYTNSVSNVGVVPTATNTKAGGGATTVDAAVPTSIQNGDILVAFFRTIWIASGSHSFVTVTAPGGWSLGRADNVAVGAASFQVQGAYYTHSVTNVSGEPATYTWSINSSTGIDFIGVDMIAVRGCTGVDANSFNSTGADSTSNTVPGITVANDNEPVLVWGGYATDGGGITLDIVSVENQVADQGTALYATVSGVSGSTSNSYAITSTVGANSMAYQVAFIPAYTNAVKIVNSTVINRYSSVMSQAITIPSGTLAADLLVAHVIGPTGGTITPPAGWTAVTNASADDATMMATAYTHTVAGGDPASVTFTFSGSTTGCASIIAFRNANTSNFIASNSIIQGSTPTLTNIAAQSLVLMYETCHNNPAGFVGVGLPEAMFITPFVYNPNARNGGNISRSGSLSVMLQTAANGGVIGTQYRAANGSVAGPQMTIAIGVFVPAPVPPPPSPLPPPGPPGPSFPLPFKGLLATQPSFPPVHDNQGKVLHEVNLLLGQKLADITKLHNQLVRYASNPQLHYKIVDPVIPTANEYDANTNVTSNIPISTSSGGDSLPVFQGTGYTTTTGDLQTGTLVTIHTATLTTIVTVTPRYPINQNDVVYVQFNGTFSAGMALTVLEIQISGTPSTQIYAGYTTTVDSSQNFAITQQFSVTPATPVANDTGMVIKVRQATGGDVTLGVFNASGGNIQSR